MEQKVEFIHEWLTQKYTIKELCRSFSISRPTAYKFISRYEKMGLPGLIEQKEHLSATPTEPIIKLRGQF